MNKRTTSSKGLRDLFPISHSAMSQEFLPIYKRLFGPDYQGPNYIDRFKEVGVSEEIFNDLIDFLYPVWLWNLEKLNNDTVDNGSRLFSSGVPIAHILTIALGFLSTSKPNGLGSRSKQAKDSSYHDSRTSDLKSLGRYLDRIHLKLSQKCHNVPKINPDLALKNIQELAKQINNEEFQILQVKWGSKAETYSFHILYQCLGKKNTRAVVREAINFLKYKNLKLNISVKTWENRITIAMGSLKKELPQTIEKLFVQKESEFVKRTIDLHKKPPIYDEKLVREKGSLIAELYKSRSMIDGSR